MSGLSLVWFRQDLRLADNPALSAAARKGDPIAALYVLDDETPGAWADGAASRWWLHYSLESLAHDLERHGIHLILRRGNAQRVVPELVKSLQADAVFWNRCYDPASIARDKGLKETLRQSVTVETFNALLLHEPERLKTGGGTPFKVFTPFYRALRTIEFGDALPVPQGLKGSGPHHGDRVEDWMLLPTRPDWAGGLRATWKPGEAEAHKRFDSFVAHGLKDYAAARDRPDGDTTSRLSPCLHHGELSPRQIWHALSHEQAKGGAHTGIDKFLSELAWREFAYHNLYHFPELPDLAQNPRYRDFPYDEDSTKLHAWQRGQTGYPVIDAAMRQLWQTGWMHNRMRMAAASFLIKHLGIPWRTGERWFWDTLVDADLASNALGWQWVAGSGPDAAPYYRIFNPILQSLKFDPDGGYIRRYVPELAKLSNEHIHTPWEAPLEALKAAGIELGKTYPHPIVDHSTAREAALARLKEI